METSGKKKKGKVAPLKIKIGRKKKQNNKDSEVQHFVFLCVIILIGLCRS